MRERISPLTIIGFAIFLALVVWLAAAIGNMHNANQKQKLEAVRSSVENGITLCYAIEGAYPESLEYLTESYGVVYDSESYIVHYGFFAANIRPNVTVMERTDT